MATIAEAYVQLKPSMKGFEGQMNSELGPQMGRAGTSGGKAFGGSFVPMLGGMAVAGAAALIGLGVAGAAVGISTAASMERARISFTTMLGSAEKADVFLKQLADFAAKTPFEFPELQTAASSLISAGISADKVIPIMTTLGDVTAGMGTGSDGIKRATTALQQMQAAGKITGEDLNQLRDAGIPVYDLLAAATGKSKEEVVKLANAGKLGKKELDAMMGALASGKGLEKFSGLMEAQSQSLDGMVSTLKDNLGMGLAKAMQPLIPIMKDGIGKTAQWLGDTAMPALAKGIQWAIDTFKAFSSSGEVGVAKAFLADLGTVVTTQVIPALKAIGDWIMTNVAPSFMQLVAAVQGAFNIIAPIVTQLVSGIMEKVGPLMPTIIGIFTGIGSIVASVMSILGSIIKSTFDNIKIFWDQWGGTITAVVSGIFSYVVNIIAAAVDIIKGIFAAVSAAMKGDWSGAWEAIKTMTSAAWGHIQGAFTAARDSIGRVMADVGSAIWDALKGAFDKALTIGNDIARGIGEGISRGISWVVDAAKRVAGSALQAVKDFLGIKSPSTVMRDQVGFQMSAGIGQGITRGGGLIDSAMSALVSRSLSPISVNGSASFAGASTGNGAGLGMARVHPDDIAAIVNGFIASTHDVALTTISADKWGSSLGGTTGRSW